jgi:hypothetical protein
LKDEVADTVFLCFSDVLQEIELDFGFSGERINRNFQFECLCIDIPDLDSSLVMKEDSVSRPVRVNTNIGFLVIFVREEGFDDEVS